jgi:hypothetical protein
MVFLAVLSRAYADNVANGETFVAVHLYSRIAPVRILGQEGFAWQGYLTAGRRGHRPVRHLRGDTGEVVPFIRLIVLVVGVHFCLVNKRSRIVSDHDVDADKNGLARAEGTDHAGDAAASRIAIAAGVYHIAELDARRQQVDQDYFAGGGFAVIMYREVIVKRIALLDEQFGRLHMNIDIRLGLENCESPCLMERFKAFSVVDRKADANKVLAGRSR